MHWENIMEKLRFAYRQKAAFYAAQKLVHNFPWKRWLSSLVLLCELIGCILFDTPYSPHGEALRLEDYRLVMVDEFRGDAVDTSLWNVRDLAGDVDRFYTPSQASVHDDNLYLTAQYREDGAFGAGWYSGALHLKEQYTNGYFEIRCKCNKAREFWSAFWLLAENPYDHVTSNGGVGGAEIDIMESTKPVGSRSKRTQNSVISTIHCNGWDADESHIDSRILGRFYVDDIFDTYNTYGMMWTEDEYIFYINGVESCRSSFGNGVSRVPEEVIVSLELPAPQDLPTDRSEQTQMIVDYVKIYQKTVFAS